MPLSYVLINLVLILIFFSLLFCTNRIIKKNTNCTNRVTFCLNRVKKIEIKSQLTIYYEIGLTSFVNHVSLNIG